MECNGLSCIFQPSRAPPRPALSSRRTAPHSLTKLFATTHVTDLENRPKTKAYFIHQKFLREYTFDKK